GPPLHLGRDRAAHRRRLPELPVISAVVVSHGHAAELEHSLPALAPQVDELLVIANVAGSVGDLPKGTRVLENDTPLSFAANANRGFANTSGDYVVIANPDAVPEPEAVANES